mgnify:FL=1
MLTLYRLCNAKALFSIKRHKFGAILHLAMRQAVRFCAVRLWVHRHMQVIDTAMTKASEVEVHIQVAAEQLLLSGAPSNVTVLDVSRAMRTQFRIAVLPSLCAELPWDMLAHCLAANLPVLASSEPLLEDAIGVAGIVVPTSQPLEAWLDALDQIVQDGRWRRPQVSGPAVYACRPRRLRSCALNSPRDMSGRQAMY